MAKVTPLAPSSCEDQEQGTLSYLATSEFHGVHQLNISEFANVTVLILAFITHLSEHLALSGAFAQEAVLLLHPKFLLVHCGNCMSQQLHCGPDLHEFAL